MIKEYITTKVQQFKVSAGSFWGQAEAKKLWNDNKWKLGLKSGELYSLTEGWAQYCLNSDKSKLDTACDKILIRLQKKEGQDEANNT
jgi:hypothetical protein